MLTGLPALIVGAQHEGMLRDGRGFITRTRSPEVCEGVRCRAYGTNGRLIGIVKFDADALQWRPDKIFAAG